jgi:hypothetical protein
MSLENTNTVNKEFVDRVVDDVVKVVDSFGLRVTRTVYSNIVQSEEFSSYVATYTEIALFKHILDIVNEFDREVTSETTKTFGQLYGVLDSNKLYLTQAVNTMYDRYVNGLYDNFIIDLATHLAESFEHTRTKILPIANELSKEFESIFRETRETKAKCQVIEVSLPTYCVDLYNELNNDRGVDIISATPSLDALVSNVDLGFVIDLSLEEIVSIKTLTRSDLIGVAEQMLAREGVSRIFCENGVVLYGHLVNSFREFISNGSQYDFETLIEYSIIFNGLRDNSNTYETNANIRACVDGIISYINAEIIGSVQQYYNDIKFNKLIISIEDTRSSDKDFVARLTVNKSVLDNVREDIPDTFLEKYYLSVAYLNATKGFVRAMEAVDIVFTANKFGEAASKLFDTPDNVIRANILNGYINATSTTFEAIDDRIHRYNELVGPINNIIYGGVDIDDFDLMAASLVEVIVADAHGLASIIKKIRSLRNLGYDQNSSVIYGYVENAIDNILSAVTVFKPKIPKSGVIV